MKTPNHTTHPALNDDNDDVMMPDIVDDDDDARESTEMQPWNPGKIRITTKHFSLRDVVDQIRDKELDLAPDFQRDYVWKQRQRTRLIESILLGIPLPAFYFNQDTNGTYQVVDGVQRLSTISLFMNNSHVLDKSDLEYLHGLHGLSYDKLDPASFRRFRSTQIVVHVIEPQTPDEVKYDIFGRVNTLGSPLSAQEIRHAMSKDRSRNFLKSLSELEEFDKATGWNYWRKDAESEDGWTRYSGRMANRELALRFCAFRHYSDEEYRKYSSLDAFLVGFTHRLDGISEQGTIISDRNLKKLEADFKRAMENAFEILDKAAFRRWPLGQNRRGPINRAVFESQAIALADYSLDKLIKRKEKIQRAFREAFDSKEFASVVTVGTGAPAAVQRRLQFMKDVLAKALK